VLQILGSCGQPAKLFWAAGYLQRRYTPKNGVI